MSSRSGIVCYQDESRPHCLTKNVAGWRPLPHLVKHTRKNQTIAGKVRVVPFMYLATDQTASQQCKECRLSGQVSRLNSLELRHI